MEEAQSGWLIKSECKCPKCGKIFYIWDRSKWAYKSYESKGHKANSKYYCSWGCMRAAEKERKEEEKKCARCGRLLEKGSKGSYCDMCKTLLFIEKKRVQIRQEQSKANQTEEKNKLQEFESGDESEKQKQLYDIRKTSGDE